MAYKPRSLDDINSLYDTEVAANRAIEQAKSKVVEESPKLNFDYGQKQEPTSKEQVQTSETVPDLSDAINMFIRSFNEPAQEVRQPKFRSAQRPSQVPVQRQARPGVQLPRTGIQPIESQKMPSGNMKKTARPVGEERLFNGGFIESNAENGGPNYAQQKAAQEEARRLAAQKASKKRKEDENKYTVGGRRAPGAGLDDLMSDYTRIMNDEDESKASRRERKRKQKSEERHISEQSKVEESVKEEQVVPEEKDTASIILEQLYQDAMRNISEEDRMKGVGQDREFNGYFDGTDMESLPYSLKQVIYDEMVRYDTLSRETQEEYDRRKSEAFARTEAESELLKVEQQRIRAQQRQNAQSAEEARAARKKAELIEQRRQKAEEVRQREEEIRRLREEKEALLKSIEEEERRRTSAQTEPDYEQPVQDDAEDFDEYEDLLSIKEAKRLAKEQKKAEKEAKKAAKMEAKLAKAEEKFADEDVTEDDNIQENVNQEEVIDEEVIDEEVVTDETSETASTSVAIKLLRVFLSLLLVVSIALLGCVLSVDKLFKVNSGNKSAISEYYMFTADNDIADTTIKSGDLVLVWASDKAENGQTVAFVDAANNTYGFGTKTGVAFFGDSTIYVFSQGGYQSRDKVVGIVDKSITGVGSVLSIVTSRIVELEVALGLIVLALFIILILSFRLNKKSKKDDDELEDEELEEQAETLDEPETTEVISYNEPENPVMTDEVTDEQEENIVEEPIETVESSDEEETPVDYDKTVNRFDFLSINDTALNNEVVNEPEEETVATEDNETEDEVDTSFDKIDFSDLGTKDFVFEDVFSSNVPVEDDDFSSFDQMEKEMKAENDRNRSGKSKKKKKNRKPKKQDNDDDFDIDDIYGNL